MADGMMKLPGLMTPSKSYKPFRYAWAYDFWKLQQQVHWLPEEVPLGEDCKDWVNKLNDKERNLLTQIFRFFTQSGRGYLWVPLSPIPVDGRTVERCTPWVPRLTLLLTLIEYV